MEYFPAANDDQMTVIKRLIDDCDYYILILGGRYGSIEHNSQKSYTQLEYEYAMEKGLPILAFYIAAPGNLLNAKVEKEHPEKMEAFVKLVKGNRMCKDWKNADDLAGKVSTSLDYQIKNYPRIGWVKADKVASDEANSSIIRLKEANKKLEEQISFLSSSIPHGTECYMQGDDLFCIHYEVSLNPFNDEEKCRDCSIQKTDTQTERFGGLLIIKEDDEYHYLSREDGDERFKILDDYLLMHKPNNCTNTTIKVDWELIRFYVMMHKKEFSLFNPIENANIEENDFLGGKLLALKSYYEKLPCYVCQPVSILDFFISIGWDETILLHKIIRQPMKAVDWRDLKVMQLKGFKTYEEYKNYRRTAGSWHEDDDGWYDGFYGYLAPTRKEAINVFRKREGYTIEDAYEEIKKITWEI